MKKVNILHIPFFFFLSFEMYRREETFVSHQFLALACLSLGGTRDLLSSGQDPARSETSLHSIQPAAWVSGGHRTSQAVSPNARWGRMSTWLSHCAWARRCTGPQLWALYIQLSCNTINPLFSKFQPGSRKTLASPLNKSFKTSHFLVFLLNKQINKQKKQKKNNNQKLHLY